MAWIQVDQSLPTHRKLRKLRRLLNAESAAHVVGYLVCLWLWAIDNAPDGDLSVIEAEDVAEISGWNGDADIFVDALIKVGFLDADRTLHDWSDYCGRLLERREKARNRMRMLREQNPNVLGYTTTEDTKYTVDNITQPPLVSTVNRPTIAEVAAEAKRCGYAVNPAEFLRDCSAREWRDNEGRPILKWQGWLRTYVQFKATKGTPTALRYNQRNYAEDELRKITEQSMHEIMVRSEDGGDTP